MVLVHLQWFYHQGFILFSMYVTKRVYVNVHLVTLYMLFLVNLWLCFSEKDYENAIKYYSEALELNPSNAIYYSNRSLAYLRTECYGYALADATKALEIDKNYIKGYYRRATSNMALGKFKAALKDYETVRNLQMLYCQLKCHLNLKYTNKLESFTVNLSPLSIFFRWSCFQFYHVSSRLKWALNLNDFFNQSYMNVTHEKCSYLRIYHR